MKSRSVCPSSGCGPTIYSTLPQDEVQSKRISELVGSELSATLKPDSHGRTEYRHTKRDRYLARRTMRR